MSDTSTEFLCTVTEAKKIIRNAPARTDFHIWFRTELPIVDSENKVFPGLALVTITRKAALDAVDSALGKILEGRGGRISVSVRTHEFNSRIFNSVILG